MTNLIKHFAKLCKVNNVSDDFISVETFVDTLINSRSSDARDDLHQYLFEKGMDANIYEIEQTKYYEDFISDVTSELEDLYVY